MPSVKLWLAWADDGNYLRIMCGPSTSWEVDEAEDAAAAVRRIRGVANARVDTSSSSVLLSIRIRPNHLQDTARLAQVVDVIANHVFRPSSIIYGATNAEPFSSSTIDRVEWLDVPQEVS